MSGTGIGVGTAVSACAIVLAAGAGRRAGGPKAVYRVGGERLVDRAVTTARAGGCTDVVVVVRAGVVVGNARAVVNPDPDRGLSSSLALGIAAAQVTDASCALVLLADQPGITAAAVSRLLAAAGAPGPGLWFATYDGSRAHPVRIDRPLWSAVAECAHGDAGANVFARAHPQFVRELGCDGLADPQDLDTAQQLGAWRDRTVLATEARRW